MGDSLRLPSLADRPTPTRHRERRRSKISRWPATPGTVSTVFKRPNYDGENFRDSSRFSSGWKRGA